MLRPSKVLVPGTISVGSPIKIHDAIDPHVRYKVRMSEHPGIVVERRYNDFLWLADVLKAENEDCLIPELPKKKAAGRFSDVFIESRRKALEEFLNKIADHLVLSQSSHFETFLVAPEDSFYAAKLRTTSPWTSVGLGRPVWRVNSVSAGNCCVSELL